jgi:hypothetical protein
MSQYCTISGEIKYNTDEDFERALNLLKTGGWVNSENHFVDETEFRISEETTILPEDRIICIPLCHYRNLGYILEKLFQGATGQVIWTSSDGCFAGGIISDGNETHYDLEEWAKDNMPEEDATPPEIEDVENYCEWQQEIEQAFFEDFS